VPQGCTIVKPEHICVMSGCGAVLSAMFNLLGEAGDAVLIPAPYYPGFDFDTQVC
jgi:aspartate/methionine/tyrosine aminotransferase